MNADRAHGAHDERMVTVLHLRRLAANEGNPQASHALRVAAEDFALLRHRKGYALAQHTEAIQRATAAWLAMIVTLQGEAAEATATRQRLRGALMLLREVLRLLAQTSDALEAMRRPQRASLVERMWGLVRKAFRRGGAK